MSAQANRRGLLLDILGWARPHDSETERRFAKAYLDTIPGMKSDGFGNRYIRVGDLPNVMWSCHIDTVCHQGLASRQQIAFDPDTGIASLKFGQPKMSLGADDGVGVWIMLNMIEAKRPGLYVFHRGEEVGCLGSAHIKANETHLFHGIDAAMAFDRAGYDDVITHQAYGRTCSDAFARSFALQLNKAHSDFDFKPCDDGVCTDTNEYAGIIPECSNLSIGYFGQHSHTETTNVYHAEAVLAAMLDFDTSLLAIERDPAEQMDDRYDYRPGKWGKIDTPFDEIMEIIAEFPHVAARLLMDAGYDADGLWGEVLDWDQIDQRYEDSHRPAYEPLMDA